MSDNNTTREAGGSKGAKKGDSVLKEARAHYDAGYDRDKDNIELAYDDLTFLAGENYSQWPEAQRKERECEGRPVLQINRLPQFVHQITGDIRQMKPSIKVVPVDNGADEKLAGLYAGLIRYIENRSDASGIYFRAADSQVACGIGHWRVLTEYADSSTFNQEIRIGPIEDGVAVIWDPDAVLPTKEDAKFCFVPIDMSRAAFEKKWPNVSPASFDDEHWGHNNTWCTDDYVRVAEYWVKKPTKKTLALGLDGSIADLTDADASVIAYHKSKGARIEKRDSTKVCRYLISASAVLEGPEDWPGRFIPIVPVIGEEIRIGRKLIRKGIVRDAKDPQRMSNFFHSAHTETVALQPKAPFMVTEHNVSKYQTLWESANTKNLPYLVYEPDTKNSGAAPQRIQPPVSSQGILDGLTMAGEDLKAVIGIYDAGLGNKSNETSGKAILARQREGDVGSYVFVDNFARAVRHTGNIIVDMIRYIYDTERTIRIMGEDGKVDILEVNKTMGIDPASGETVYNHDMTVGSYDVVAQIGPSYSTKREEAKEGMVEFIRAAPEAGALILDLLAKAQDWPMADDIAKRFRANLPPAILKMEELEKQGASPEQIQQVMEQEKQNQPPPPEVMEAQANIQIKQQDQQMQQAQAANDAQLQQEKMVIDQQNAERQAQLEMAKLAEAARQADEKLQAEIMLEREKIASQERIAIHAQEASARASQEKNAIEFETRERDRSDKYLEQENAKQQHAASSKQGDAKLKADLTLERERIASDERSKIRVAEINARARADNKPEPRA